MILLTVGLCACQSPQQTYTWPRPGLQQTREPTAKELRELPEPLSDEYLE